MEKFLANSLLKQLNHVYVPPEEKPRRIIDLRNKEKFFMDDLYLNGYARHCGVAATCVYLSLCRHSDKAQTCWPSQNHIAKELGITRKTVYNAVKTLQKWGIVDVYTQRGKDGTFKVTTYTLIDKSKWDTLSEKPLNKRHG